MFQTTISAETTTPFLTSLQMNEGNLTLHNGELLTRDRVRGILYGVALGDALGLPVETMSAVEIKQRFGDVRDFLPVSVNSYYSASNEVGIVSDDLNLTLTVMRAITSAGGFDLGSIIAAHKQELDRDPRGWGSSTKNGVTNAVEFGPEWWRSRPLPSSPLGNGIPMKISPLALLTITEELDHAAISRDVIALSQFTHPTSIGVASGAAHLAALRYCLSVTTESFSVEDFCCAIIAATHCAIDLPFNFIQIEDSGHNAAGLRARFETLSNSLGLSEQEIIERYDGGCAALLSLPFSYAFFLRDFKSVNSLYSVVNGGGDTDSNGALVGALLGALHGSEIFPRSLLERIVTFNEIDPVVDSFCDRFRVLS